MAEPSATAAAATGVAAGGLATAAAVGDWLGIDAAALLWGAAGGLAMLSAQPPVTRSRALIIIAVASLFAGALTEGVAHWGASTLPTTPPRALAHGTAFLLGLTAQWLIPLTLNTLPALRDALVARARGPVQLKPKEGQGNADGQ